MRRAVLLGLLIGGLLAAPAAAQDCLTADPPAITKPAQPLRFGITPGPAGSAGVAQAQVKPRDEALLTRELVALRGDRELVLRLNRLFWSDGSAGIAEFARTVDRYAGAGLRSEVQVRYHPPEGRAGDMAGWSAFVREAVRTLGPRPSVVGFSITNEANLPASPNTSDGAYEGVVDALITGTVVAREELAKLGRGDLPVGFNVMWRFSPDSDEAFWKEIAAKATPAFRKALTYVGAQVYPGLVWPPAPRPGVSAGAEMAEALTLIRSCYMPIAGLGPETQLWVTENGYATNLGRDEASQAAALASTVEAVHAYSGELGVTDYRWFNLRDNFSTGTDLFAAVGVLRDDHARKPAFAVLADAIARVGTAPPAPGAGATRVRPRVRVGLARGGRVRGRLLGVPAGVRCGGRVTVRFLRGGRTYAVRRAKVRPDCSFTVRRRPRGARRFTARFHGTARLAPASGARARR
jgi:hypothetical protein